MIHDPCHGMPREWSPAWWAMDGGALVIAIIYLFICQIVQYFNTGMAIWPYCNVYMYLFNIENTGIAIHVYNTYSVGTRVHLSMAYVQTS